MNLARLRRLGGNFLGFQATWFACVGGAGVGYPLLGPLVGIPWLGLHLARLDGHSPQAPLARASRSVEIRLLLAAALTGYLCDSLLALGGALSFPAQVGPALPTTPWMITLWVGFAATLRHSMDWLRGRYLLGAAAGAVFGPLAYRAGQALNAISVEAAPFGWLAVAIAWACAMPLLLWLRERLEQP